MASTVPNNEATQFKAGAKQVEIARKGGYARQEKARQRKTLKEELELMLECIDKETGTTYQESITAGMVINAKNKKKGGNPEAYKLIAKMLKQYEDKESSIEAKEPVLNITITSNEDLKEEFYKE